MDFAAYRAAAHDATERASLAEDHLIASRRRYEELSHQVAPMLERGRARAERNDGVRRERAAAMALVATLAAPLGALRPLSGASADR